MTCLHTSNEATLIKMVNNLLNALLNELPAYLRSPEGKVAGGGNLHSRFSSPATTTSIDLVSDHLSPPPPPVLHRLRYTTATTVSHRRLFLHRQVASAPISSQSQHLTANSSTIASLQRLLTALHRRLTALHRRLLLFTDDCCLFLHCFRVPA
ncbi:hypothetical protein LXL04_007701 [Taraxacum kok-saghyz]